jgi:hypothetical protein
VNRSRAVREHHADDPDPKEETMAVMMMAEMPGVSTAMYDEVNRMIGISPVKLPDGLISHNAGDADGTLVVVDVWESPEAFERFARETAGPVLERLGAPQIEPRVLPVHNMIEQGQGDRAGVMMIVEMANLTPETYDEMTSRMSGHGGDGSNHPAVSHTAARANGGLLIVDVWDAPESFQRFAGEQIAEAEASDIGPIEPRFVPIHNRFTRS